MEGTEIAGLVIVVIQKAQFLIHICTIYITLPPPPRPSYNRSTSIPKGTPFFPPLPVSTTSAARNLIQISPLAGHRLVQIQQTYHVSIGYLILKQRFLLEIRLLLLGKHVYADSLHIREESRSKILDWLA